MRIKVGDMVLVTRCSTLGDSDHNDTLGDCVCEVIGRVGPVKAIDRTQRYGIYVLIDDYWPEFSEDELTVVEKKDR